MFSAITLVIATQASCQTVGRPMDTSAHTVLPNGWRGAEPQRTARVSTRSSPRPDSPSGADEGGIAGGRFAEAASETSTRTRPAAVSTATRRPKPCPGTRPWSTAFAESSATTRATAHDASDAGGYPRSSRCRTASCRASRAPRGEEVNCATRGGSSLCTFVVSVSTAWSVLGCRAGDVAWCAWIVTFRTQDSSGRPTLNR